jgi:CheY-like chemotaxis protein
MFDIRCQQKKLDFRVEIWHPPEGPLAQKPKVAPRAPKVGAESEDASGQGRQMEAWRLLVRGDVQKLRQVLINLLSNAVKFTDKGGVILEVVLPPVQKPAAAPQWVPEPNRNGPSIAPYYFEVRDSGPGISPEAQATLFQPFHQGTDAAKLGGTGLGLAIAARQITLMGGQLQVKSQLGVGSRFFFNLPLAPAKGTEVAGPVRPGVCHLTAGYAVRALIVDDVRENREVLAALLADVGCDVKTAPDGPKALELVHSDAPDVIFMDIRMPGMDGTQTAQKIRADPGRQRAPIIACSASALTHEQQRYFAAGFDGFIAKPFRLESVCECLEEVLNVKFDYASAPDITNAAAAVLDYSQVKVPKRLLQRLRSAAESYSVTELKGYFKELEELGDPQRHLAGQLRELLQSYDMEGISTILAATGQST